MSFILGPNFVEKKKDKAQSTSDWMQSQKVGRRKKRFLPQAVLLPFRFWPGTHWPGSDLAGLSVLGSWMCIGLESV